MHSFPLHCCTLFPSSQTHGFNQPGKPVHHAFFSPSLLHPFPLLSNPWFQPARKTRTPCILFPFIVAPFSPPLKPMVSTSPENPYTMHSFPLHCCTLFPSSQTHGFNQPGKPVHHAFFS